MFMFERHQNHMSQFTKINAFLNTSNLVKQDDRFYQDKPAAYEDTHN